MGGVARGHSTVKRHAHTDAIFAWVKLCEGGHWFSLRFVVTGSECVHAVDFQTAPPWVLDRPPPSRLLLNFKKKGPHFNDIESRGRSIPKVNDQLGLTIWLNFGRKSELQSVHNLRSFILLINSTIRDSIGCGCSAGVGQRDHESSHTPSRRSATDGGKHQPRTRGC